MIYTSITKKSKSEVSPISGGIFMHENSNNYAIMLLVYIKIMKDIFKYFYLK